MKAHLPGQLSAHALIVECVAQVDVELRMACFEAGDGTDLIHGTRADGKR